VANWTRIVVSIAGVASHLGHRRTNRGRLGASRVRARRFPLRPVHRRAFAQEPVRGPSTRRLSGQDVLDVEAANDVGSRKRVPR